MMKICTKILVVKISGQILDIINSWIGQIVMIDGEADAEQYE